MAEGVRKRGSKWYYYFDVAKVAGQRKRIEKGGFDTQKQAVEERIKAIAEYNNTGKIDKGKKMSLSDYLDWWITNVIQANIDNGYAYKTYMDYESKVRLYIKPTLGKYKLSVIQYAPDKIQEWVNDLKRQGYSKSTVQNSLGVLGAALKYAITPLKYINANPCSLVKVGKFAMDLEQKQRNEYICSPKDIQQIFELIQPGTPMYYPLLLAYCTGVRVGEAFGLDLLHDIDFERHEITIRGQITKRGSVYAYKTPKYDSFRTVKIGKLLENALKENIEQRKESQKKYGKNYVRSFITKDGIIEYIHADQEEPEGKEAWFLCAKPNGKPYMPSSISSPCVRIRKHLNLPYFRFHTLRHTHGTILAENGVNPKTVMERLGHRDITTTLQTYTFNTEQMQISAVDIFDKNTLFIANKEIE